MILHKNFLINNYKEKVYRRTYFQGVSCFNKKYVTSLEQELSILRRGKKDGRHNKDRILHRVFDNHIDIR